MTRYAIEGLSVVDVWILRSILAKERDASQKKLDAYYANRSRSTRPTQRIREASARVLLCNLVLRQLDDHAKAHHDMVCGQIQNTTT